jgi:hypothetical protein
MADEKKILGMSKPMAYVVGIGGAIAVVLVYKHYQSASAAAAANSASNTAATTSTAAQDIDPETGYPYGSVQDEEALAGMSGEGAEDEYGSDLGLTSEPYYSSEPTTESPTTNAAWSQYVQQQLSTIGYDAETVAGAVGAYLAQIPLTSNQAQIIQVALAECGPPPQGEYSIIPQSTTSTSTSTGTGTSSTSTGTTSSSGSYPAPTGLSDTPYATSVDLGWTPVSGATNYHYQVQQDGHVNADQVVSVTHASVPSLKSNTTYQWRVSADPSGQWSAWRSFKTT